MFVIINIVGMKISGGVNVKNWLIKVVAIKDLFGMLVTVNVNGILENIQAMKIENVGKLVEECTENIDVVKLAKTTSAEH